MGAGAMRLFLTAPAFAVAITACASAPTPEAEPSTPAAPQHPVMPKQVTEQNSSPASLWATSPTSLLALRRAKDVGDLLTVVVQMNDQASMQSSRSRSRESQEKLDIAALFGLPDLAGSVLPNNSSLSPAFDFDRQSDMSGTGRVNRAEKVTFRLSARVVGVEPNGNLIIHGYQQTLVSNELRYLMVSGVIRSQDITRTNTVSYEKIADAQFSYVSEGEATGAMRRAAVPRLLDRFVPF